MNRYAALGFLGLGLMVSPLLATGSRTGNLAQSAVPANVKIGVIDIENTLTTTPAGKRANDAFDKNRKAKQSDLDKRQNDLKKSAQDLEKQKLVLKEDIFVAKQQELQKKFVDLQETYMKLERELAADRTKLVQELLKQAQPRIEKIAKAEGVHLIIDQSAVIWTSPDVDLTARLNAEMK